MSKYKSRGVNLDLTKEEDILIEQHLLKQRNISQYIRQLILKDIGNQTIIEKEDQPKEEVEDNGISVIGFD
ncbi:MAG: hypothetical protein PUJ51_00050 [Clostridiales bacterium]|uniref:hypothetical protein n=1 Tax=Terrisporobacter sp. TaxID=1965305 RepID=UPI002A5939D2|nr:hypothetical protein [Terrisporobacter sp.]MDD7752895.1 hypothetical protein [Clostridiales bacterium]MDY4134210.1 hypothetical protein [Terrisporobacter sp.]